ncbi:MAG: GNAT family N-acetyltransferase [Actinobacteria bacterium]|nr:GNAT family N-acetyltransferase [Actinomycetota bacterium]
MHIREFRPGDEYQIADLFKASFKRKLDLDEWRWRYVENPFGQGIIRLMYDNETLAGHYAVIPMALLINGKVRKAALSMTTMTHPDYFKRGIFTRLASEVYDYCRDTGIKAVFGFPNSNSYHGLTNKLLWHGFGNVSGWAANSKSAEKEGDSGLTFSELHESSVGQLIEMELLAQEAKMTMIHRTPEFFKWRYFQKPGNEYDVFEVRNALSDLEGIVVLKTFRGTKGEEEAKGHIIDLLAPEKPKIIKYILKNVLAHFAENNINTVTCWLPNHEVINGQMEEEGFSRMQWPTFFGVRLLDKKFDDAPLLLQKNRWSLTMGESDVF